MVGSKFRGQRVGVKASADVGSPHINMTASSIGVEASAAAKLRRRRCALPQAAAGSRAVRLCSISILFLPLHTHLLLRIPPRLSPNQLHETRIC